MKTLKLDHELAQQVLAGTKTSTWRLFDDKNLSVGDTVRFVDKVDPERPETWRVIGTGRINQLIEKRLGEITDEDMEGHETIASHDELLTTYQKYYGNDVSDTTVVKIIRFDFDNNLQTKDVTNTSKSVRKLALYTDGGSRGNPGPSAFGFVVIEPTTGQVLVDRGQYLGVTTNNQAEYIAVKYGLEEIRRMGAREVEAFLDSQLVVNQLKGVFRVSNRDLWPIHEAIKQLSASFDRVSFTHIPREQNSLADAAVNRALDEHLGSQPPRM